MPVMADSFADADVRRQVGWLPGDQEDLETWLAGHRERVRAERIRRLPRPADQRDAEKDPDRVV